ncbi:MAG: Rpn family recombination-promoting nuclease/putative transposase [Candidatus Electrothrix aestuarii]|uniref:Rpn family recombination-promoting nuclease/putative transposase n=1 Tax=Candidatus Electrothrix aestuarii TaxID=3062594 RepID=A0AAU8LVB1_9BACT|nr:Rpn family recombination-promoting nuclease/putative transposase [Candidatus Electrothrix aestuarii]
MKKHIRFDWAIKRLLRQKANFGILEGFLSELLKEDIKISEILESESNKEREGSKFNKIDILVKNTADDLMLIEVQNERERDFFHRMNFGQAKLLTEHISEGEDYENIKKIFSINIVYFDLGLGKDYVYIGSTNFVGMHTDDVLELNAAQKKAYPISKVSDIFTTYYLLKVNKFDDLAKDSLDEWIYFLKNNEIKDEFKARGLKEAKDKLRVDNLPEDEKKNYEKYLDSKRIEQNVYKTALAEGRELADREVKKANARTEAAEAKAKKERKQKEEERRQKEKAQAEEMKMLSITAKALHESGMDMEQIARKLQRPVEVIRDILL